MLGKISMLAFAAILGFQPLEAIDIEAVPPDLVTPKATAGDPAPGKRVIQVGEGYEGTQVHHLIYFPKDWVKGRKYPVIVEYAGNR